MTEKYIKINLERFEPNRKVLFDFYLHMPVNNKMIRLLTAGSELDLATLEKFKTKKISFLFIPSDGQGQTDPNLIKIQEDSVNNVVALIETVNTPEPTIETATVVAPVEPQEENNPDPSIPLATVETEDILTANAAAQESPEATLSPIENISEPETHFSADPTQNDETQLIKGSSENPEEEEIRISSDPTEKELMRMISGSNGEKELDEFRFNSKEEDKAEEAFRFSSKIDSINEELSAGKEISLEEKAEELLNDMRLALTVNKIAKEIIQLSLEAKKLPFEERIEANNKLLELSELMENIETASVGLENLDLKFSVDTELNEIRNVMQKSGDLKFVLSQLSTQMQKIGESKNIALKYFGDVEHSLRAIRDIPSTAARLATQLGHALGYVNLNYLSELALSAILHFSSVKESKGLEKIELFNQINDPNKEHTNPVIQDSIEIMWMIDQYINDPDCDRVNKDFEPNVFDSALQSLLKSKNNLNIWNATKWKQFIEMEPNVETHSLCSKACSIAFKKSEGLGL